MISKQLDTKSKQLRFNSLIARVQACTLCPRMIERRKVLGTANGNLDASVIFIGEAPGRLGADRYGIPLYGDQTGRNFESFILGAGIRRDDIFITNTVLCNPRKQNGNNDSPTLAEIRNCAVYLKEILDIIKPSYVVTLGAVALRALNGDQALEVSLGKEVGQLFPWNGCEVYPLFHPGPRAFIWRTKTRQVEDYKALGALLRATQYTQEARV